MRGRAYSNGVHLKSSLWLTLKEKYINNNRKGCATTYAFINIDQEYVIEISKRRGVWNTVTPPPPPPPPPPQQQQQQEMQS
jgi:hypothetical protein